jgi:hypothetical protein
MPASQYDILFTARGRRGAANSHLACERAPLHILIHWGEWMKRHFLDTTVVYDVQGQMYLQAEMYGSGDPSETIELRILEPGQVALSDGCRWQRAAAGGLASQSWEAAETIDEPFVLEERHIKQTSTGRIRRQTKVLPCALVDSCARPGPQMVVIDAHVCQTDAADEPLSSRTFDGLPLRNER